jgi:hypothetical protein
MFATIRQREPRTRNSMSPTPDRMRNEIAAQRRLGGGLWFASGFDKRLGYLPPLLDIARDILGRLNHVIHPAGI